MHDVEGSASCLARVDGGQMIIAEEFKNDREFCSLFLTSEESESSWSSTWNLRQVASECRSAAVERFSG